MVFSAVVLACLAAATLSVREHRPAYAWGLLGVSALWLPLSNGPLEGRVLLPLTATHGVTTADVAAVVGFVLALAVLIHLEWTRLRRFDLYRMSRIAAAGTAVFGAGALVAWVSG